jgi:hypothetical protein
MGTASRTVVTFTSSDFNTTEPRDYFINRCCYGDDLAKWLIEQFKNQGVETNEEPGQEDFGWYVIFSVHAMPHCFVFSFRPPDGAEDGRWIGWVERTGALRTLLGRRTKDVDTSAVEALHRILMAAPVIHDVRWHSQPDFDRGNEDDGQLAP